MTALFRGIKSPFSLSRTRIGLLLVAILLGIIGGACGKKSVDKAQVAATIWPVADLVKQIAGNQIEVRCILPPYASPHTFSPSPGDLRNCHQVKLYFKVGRNLDNWLDRFIQDKDTRAITLSKDCPNLSPCYQIGDHDHEGHVHDHNHEDGDPHLWLDAAIVSQYWLPRITKALTATFPTQQPIFQRNATLLQKRIEETDSKISKQLQQLKPKKFITVHSALTYFATRYQLQVAAVLQPWPGKQMTPRYRQQLEQLVRRENIKVVFTEPQLMQSSSAQNIARELKLASYTIDPLGPKENYQELLIHNATIIYHALK